MPSGLPELPPSKFHNWDGADKHSWEEKYVKCEHFFERRGWNVECKKCHIGYQLIYPFYILEGKICFEDEAVI